MTADLERLTVALADRYTIERELGKGGTANDLAAESRGWSEGRFSDTSRAVASATSVSGPIAVATSDR